MWNITVKQELTESVKNPNDGIYLAVKSDRNDAEIRPNSLPDATTTGAKKQSV
jgi:hypothetical protein